MYHSNFLKLLLKKIYLQKVERDAQNTGTFTCNNKKNPQTKYTALLVTIQFYNK